MVLMVAASLVIMYIFYYEKMRPKYNRRMEYVFPKWHKVSDTIYPEDRMRIKCSQDFLKVVLKITSEYRIKRDPYFSTMMVYKMSDYIMAKRFCKVVRRAMYGPGHRPKRNWKWDPHLKRFV